MSSGKGGGGDAKLDSMTYFYNRHSTGTVNDTFKKLYNRKRFRSETPSMYFKLVPFKNTYNILKQIYMNRKESKHLVSL